MTSVERILEYTNLPQECALDSSPNKKPPKEWPNQGNIVFQKFSLRYTPDSPYILKDVNITIQSMEKVGIVGRTGAGKSSLINALFRLALNEGNIIIDGIEIHELLLDDLRSKLSIIPQEPVLFSGTMRKNLDPFDEYPDHVLWNALDEVQLKNVVENLSGGLNSKISEGGANFSVGQKQLVCLARAIVRNNKILILDEATANVDLMSDALIQNTIRNKFRSCTILIIAHRLNTIMDLEKVIVVDRGTVVEFDHPHNLLKNIDGFFYKMVDQTDRDMAVSRQNPRANANIFEILSFSWLLNLFATGRKRALKEDDLYTTLNNHKASLLGCELEKRWINELDEAEIESRKPSLLRALARMFGTQLFWYGVLQLTNEIIFRIPRSLLVGGILAYFNPVGYNQTNNTNSLISASLLIFNMAIVIVISRYVQIEVEHCGMKIRVACCSIIYKKVLRLSKCSLEENSIGQVMNLLSNDVIRIDSAFRLFHIIWIAPVGTIFATYLLWLEIGVSSLFGVFGVLIIIPLQTFISKKIFQFRSNIGLGTDERVRLMNEIISGIQAIKMYTWEKKFVHLVKDSRKKELRDIKKTMCLKFIQESFKIFHTRLALMISILIYILLGSNISTEKIFVMITFYINIRLTMTVLFPLSIGSFAEMFASIERVQTFLLTDEKQNANDKQEITAINNVACHNQNDDVEQSVSFGIVISNVSAKWKNDQLENSLNNINLNAVPGRLVTIIGPVGAGKSSLIKAILQELPLSEGSISVRGKISYASQEPWLFNSSIQNNILFNSPMDKERYLKVINVCALEADLLQLSNGDRTIVGDRGVSLSAGQRARINLARAIYRQADIYLLDDPLSAVDTHVGKYLFDKCIKSFLKKKTCILVTHQIQYLTEEDQIVLMENANKLAEGSYEKLSSINMDFLKLIESLNERTIMYVDKEMHNQTNEITHKVDNDLLSVTKSARTSLNGNSKSRELESNRFPDESSVTAETRSSGPVSLNVYFSYLLGGGSIYKLSFVLFVCILTQLLCTGEDYWISYWVNLEDRVFQNVNHKYSVNDTSSMNDKSSVKLMGFLISRQSCIIVYVALNVMLLLFVMIRCINFVSFFIETSTTLHDNMFNAITKVKMFFFNTNSTGRIINRFTKDIGSIDESLPSSIINFIDVTLSLIGTIVVIGWSDAYLLIPSFFTGICCYHVGVYYLSTSRSIKRLEGITQSPILAHVKESIEGIITVRTFKSEIVLAELFDKCLDLHSSAWYLLIASNNAFGFMIDMLCLIYLTVLIICFLTIDNEWSGGNVGLVITQTMNLMGILQFGIRQMANIDSQMISVERVLEYTNFSQESVSESALLKKPPKGWPNKGQIIFNNFFLRYSPNSSYVLKNINVKIQPREKIGIVGRTGSGKSSLINALFRLALNEGNIIIDDVEIHELELHDLRSKFSIIPQEPILFSGTMRTNLDPFNEYPDHVLWNALDEVQLKNIVEQLPDGLNTNMSAQGTNFSIGQKQLVCLARAMVQSNQILILDEATANVDLKTDTLIQNTIRNKFRSYTVLTIAHRLNTIMDSDKVLVVDMGTIVEFDSPQNLLKNKDGNNKKERSPHPRQTANVFEIVSFSWLLRLFRTGRKRTLEISDLYTTLDAHKSSKLGDELEKQWKIELSKVNRKPSLWRILYRMFGFRFMIFGITLAISEVCLKILQPLLIGGLLTYFNTKETNENDLKHAYMYAGGLAITMASSMTMYHCTMIEMLHCGMKTRIACCSAVFKKALRLSNSALGETTVGQIVNLLTNDVNRFDTGLLFLHFLWISPVQTLLATYFIWKEVGVSSVFGLGACFMFIPIQGWLGKKTSEFRLRTAVKTDERVRLMNEIISGIQVIKMYTWEKPFAYLVQSARKKEIQQIRGSVYTRATLSSFMAFHTKISLFFCIISYVFLGNIISAQKVFVIASYYSILQTTMTIRFPQGIGLLAEMLVSIKRLQNFMLFDEKVKEKVVDNVNGDAKTNNKTCDQTETVFTNPPLGVVISNATAKWTDAKPENSLENINLTVGPGRLTAIIGPVGAGKSSIVQLILRELPLTQGTLSVQGVVSYAAQEPWLFAGSVQQNILFGSPMDKERYRKVVSVCALKTDLKQLPYGDRTLVGDKGVALSGGQRARINLARAVYKQADIYLFDDPLSAVDTHVGKHLFDICIKGFLRDKIRILVTHQLPLLTNVDQIILMDDGKIRADATYAELRNSDLDFATLFRASTEKAVVPDVNKNGNVACLDLPHEHMYDRKMSVQSVDSIQSHAEPVEIAETRISGNISHVVYFKYISAGGRFFKLFFFLCTCIFTQILASSADLWITYWVNLEDHFFRSPKTGLEDSLNTFMCWTINRQICIYVFSGLTLSVIIFTGIRTATFVSVCMTASMNLHNKMFNSITRATMRFFNTNSSGRILNRFSKDIGSIDEALPVALMDTIQVGLSIIGIIILVGIINSYLLIPTVIIAFIFYKLCLCYLKTSRSIKRLEAVTRSPVFTHLNGALQGLTTIRAFEAEQILSKEFDNHQDLHSTAWYLYISSNRGFSLWSDVIVIIYIGIVTFSFIIIGKDTYGGNVGLAITQAIGLVGFLQLGIRQTSDLENQMTSVERVLEYTNIPQEAALESHPDEKPPVLWPTDGHITFNNLYLRYGAHSQYVIKNLNIKIEPREKIGIVGRTGAGKSSLIGALFRLANNEGNIIIDGIEIHGLGLHELRSKISIIPQEPVLFSGTVRKNLDPFYEYPDHVIWNALDEVELKTVVEDLPNGLNSRMTEGGSNFSVGQRQLVCLARAIVRNNRILVLDEATANVDLKTDTLIQRTIRDKFKTCTVLTIAHRLNTVMDSDKVLVMDAGQMVEFDHPHNLLKNKNGFLYKMVEQTGRDTADLLYSIAEQSYKSKDEATPAKEEPET
ncbi:Hypothetical protein CINCED_3A012061 [Cinara cedri]|nr:Hypothetical protein CINCED_3A012061 [Cinara cedri]